MFTLHNILLFPLNLFYRLLGLVMMIGGGGLLLFGLSIAILLPLSLIWHLVKLLIL